MASAAQRLLLLALACAAAASSLTSSFQVVLNDSTGLIRRGPSAQLAGAWGSTSSSLLLGRWLSPAAALSISSCFSCGRKFSSSSVRTV